MVVFNSYLDMYDLFQKRMQHLFIFKADSFGYTQMNTDPQYEAFDHISIESDMMSESL